MPTVLNRYLLRALKLAEKLVGMRSPELVPICNNLGAIHAGLDEIDMAVVYYQRALGILREIFAVVSEYVAPIGHASTVRNLSACVC